MNVYEVYFINKLKPPLNVDDKENDQLNVILPEVNWIEYKPRLWEKWVSELNRKQPEYEKDLKRYKLYIPEEFSEFRTKYRNKEITKEDCRLKIETLNKEKKELEVKLYGRY